MDAEVKETNQAEEHTDRNPQDPDNERLRSEQENGSTSTDSNDDVSHFCDLIREGTFDGFFEEIQNSMDDRRKARQEAVLLQVREVFGEAAEVTVPPAPPSKENPFIKRAGREHAQHLQAADGQPIIEEDDDRVSDPLDESMNDAERQMISEETVGEGSLESRGPIIGGMTASQMGN